jgi:hypothetical protein
MTQSEFRSRLGYSRIFPLLSKAAVIPRQGVARLVVGDLEAQKILNRRDSGPVRLSNTSTKATNSRSFRRRSGSADAFKFCANSVAAKGLKARGLSQSVIAP